MISPIRDDPHAAEELPLEEQTAAFFSAGGGLEAACAGEAFPFEPRPQQQEMAVAVAASLRDRHHLVVEAGTGVGKSFAYLVPGILDARAHGRKLLVSTYTISLQEQLILKDLPFLQEHLGVPFKAVMVKGRSNYLCLHRLRAARRMGGDLFDSDRQAELDRLHAWAQTTPTGSLQDLEEQPSPEVWDAVCAEQGICVASPSGKHQHCFYTRARRSMTDADVLVVNHHLFFAELAVRMGGAAFLPNYASAIIDEAHEMEDVATEHMGLRLSEYAWRHWMRRLYNPDNGKGLLGVLRAGPAAGMVTRVGEEVSRFYHRVDGWAKWKSGESQRVVREPLGVSTPLPDLLAKTLSELKKLVDTIEDDDQSAELNAAIRRGGALRDSLDVFLKQSSEGFVYWVELAGARKPRPVLHAAPVEVAPVLEKALFEGVDAVTMTSATLAVGESLEYFRSRVGVRTGEAKRVGSPFDYGRQMRVYVPRDIPEPNEGERFEEAASRAIQRFTLQTRGHAFVLFTSGRTMRSLAGRTRSFFESEGLPLLVQGEGMSRNAMLESFRSTPGSVLFGLNSFWMGVDVRGDALQNVMICRLPFSVPDQPVVEARCDLIRERGGDPFKDYTLPGAILRFRQGVGRLIRTGSDEGIVVVLDQRIVTKWYGRLFLAALPECPVEVVELDG